MGPPEREGKEGKQRRQEDEKKRRNRAQDGEKRREKEKSWERWTNRQTDSPKRQAHQPPPCSHPAPQARLVAPGLSFTEMDRDRLLIHASL